MYTNIVSHYSTSQNWITASNEQDSYDPCLHSSQFKAGVRQKVHSLWGYHFIVLHESLQVKEDQWYVQELQPNGDVLLRNSTILTKNRAAGSGYQTSPANDSSGLPPDYDTHKHE